MLVNPKMDYCLWVSLLLFTCCCCCGCRHIFKECGSVLCNTVTWGCTFLLLLPDQRLHSLVLLVCRSCTLCMYNIWSQAAVVWGHQCTNKVLLQMCLWMSPSKWLLSRNITEILSTISYSYNMCLLCWQILIQIILCKQLSTTIHFNITVCAHGCVCLCVNMGGIWGASISLTMSILLKSINIFKTHHRNINSQQTVG